MKLPKNCKIESAAYKGEIRPTISEPYLEIRKYGSRLIATNAKILAVVPVETTPEDVSGYVSSDALKASRKGRQIESVIRCNGTLETWDGASHPRPNLGTYPNVDQVIPKNDPTHVKRRVVVKFDSTLLSRLASAIGTEGVVMEMLCDSQNETVSDPIIVKPTSANGCQPAAPDAFGVLMPMR